MVGLEARGSDQQALSTEPAAGRAFAREPSRPGGMGGGNRVETRSQNERLVLHRLMAILERLAHHLGAMELMDGRGDARDQRDGSSVAQMLDQRRAGELALQPHRQLGDPAQWLGDADAIRGVVAETLAPEQ